MSNILGFLRRKVYVALAVISLLAAFIRFYKIAEIPVSLYWDEVSIGYNAYSIGMTGRDEFGTFTPLLFKAFNDYKMPLDIYLTALSEKAFGLDEFSVRFPSAFFGTLTVLVAFFLARQLLVMYSKKTNLPTDSIALLTSLMLAISPWHIQFSRANFEANISLFFVVLGAYLLLKGRESFKSYVFSFLSFAFAFYGYRSEFLFLPILIVGIHLIWFRRYIMHGYQKIILAIFLFALLLLPIFMPLTKEGASRYQQTSLSNKVEQVALDNFQKGRPVNKKILYLSTFLEGYVSEFTPQFLFLTGDPEGRHGARNMGMLYLWEFPFVLLGGWFIFKKTSSTIFYTVLLWVLAAPIAAALSIPTPHALRLLNILPMPQLLTALGVICILAMLPKFMKKPFIAVLSVVVLIFFVNFVRQYSLTNTKLVVSHWGDGYKQLVENIEVTESKYDKIVISGHYWQPYMYFLFYEKFSPVNFQKIGNSEHFGKYIFGGTSWDLEVGRLELDKVDLKVLAGSRKTLVALSPDEYKAQETNLRFLTAVQDHNGKTVFIVGELK